MSANYGIRTHLRTYAYARTSDIEILIVSRTTMVANTRTDETDNKRE